MAGAVPIVETAPPLEDCEQSPPVAEAALEDCEQSPLAAEAALANLLLCLEAG